MIKKKKPSAVRPAKSIEDIWRKPLEASDEYRLARKVLSREQRACFPITDEIDREFDPYYAPFDQERAARASVAYAKTCLDWIARQIHSTDDQILERQLTESIPRTLSDLKEKWNRGDTAPVWFASEGRAAVRKALVERRDEIIIGLLGKKIAKSGGHDDGVTPIAPQPAAQGASVTESRQSTQKNSEDENGMSRRAEIDNFILKCRQKIPVNVTRKLIWQTAGHKTARQFEFWQAADPKATMQDDQNFRRIIAMEPAEFEALLEALLKDKGIVKDPKTLA